MTVQKINGLPGWHREPNVVSVRGSDLESLKRAASARGLKIVEAVHVTVDHGEALYARGDPNAA